MHLVAEPNGGIVVHNPTYTFKKIKLLQDQTDAIRIEFSLEYTENA